MKRLTRTKNSVVKIQNLVVNYESRPVKLNPVQCCILKKIIKKNTWWYHFFTPKILMIWSSFLQIYFYDLVLFLECDRLKLVIIGHFLLFYHSPLPPPKNLKNQNFEKMSKSGDIILHMCTTNDDHMMYGSWDMEHDRQNFLSFIFLDHFLP